MLETPTKNRQKTMTPAEFKKFLTKDREGLSDDMANDELNVDGLAVRNKICCDKNAALWFAYWWAQANGETY